MWLDSSQALRDAVAVACVPVGCGGALHERMRGHRSVNAELGLCCPGRGGDGLEGRQGSPGLRDAGDVAQHRVGLDTCWPSTADLHMCLVAPLAEYSAFRVRGCDNF
jgi:hypothetical protein